MDDKFDPIEMYKKLVSVSEKESDEMTDEDIESIAKILGDNIPDTERRLRELPKNDASVLERHPNFLIESIKDSKSMYEGVPIEATVYIDPITGDKGIMTMEADKMSNVSVMELVEGKTASEEEMHGLIKDNISMYVDEGYDVTPSDISSILKFMDALKGDDFDQTKAFDILPGIIKKEILEMEAKSGQFLDKSSKNLLAIEFYNSMKQSMYIDQELIDLEKSIQKELDFDILDQYLDNIVVVMEQDILKTASDLDDVGEHEKAQTFRDISEAFKRSYLYTRLLTKIKNKSGVINRDTNRGIKKFDSICKKFNRMYTSTKFVIPDCRILFPILNRLLPDSIHGDSIKKFIILMISEFMKLDPDNVVDHTEMYYSIKIIESLDYIGSEESVMRQTVLSNIENVINEIISN